MTQGAACSTPLTVENGCACVARYESRFEIARDIFNPSFHITNIVGRRYGLDA